MNPTVILLLCISLIVLLVGTYAWRLTSSRPVMLNILLSSAFVFIGEYASTNNQRPEFAFMLPFFAAMLCGGYGIGMVWRSRKEPQLRLPGQILSGIGVLCFVGAMFAYLHTK